MQRCCRGSRQRLGGRRAAPCGDCARHWWAWGEPTAGSKRRIGCVGIRVLPRSPCARLSATLFLPFHVVPAFLALAGMALGMVTQLPETDDETSISRRQLLAKLDVCMGGRVAEELIFGEQWPAGEGGERG